MGGKVFSCAVPSPMIAGAWVVNCQGYRKMVCLSTEHSQWAHNYSLLFWLAFRLIYYSTRDIEAGEELTVDYVHNYNHKDEASLIAQITCLCRSDNCRKWVF